VSALAPSHAMHAVATEKPSRRFIDPAYTDIDSMVPHTTGS